MSDQEKLLDHDYDGIREFDNPLPRWWLATFYGAIIFAFLYSGFYFVGPGQDSETRLAEEMAEIQLRQNAEKKATPGPSQDELLAVFADAGRKEAGHKIFTEKCAACHGPAGGGVIGPNLTDNYWIHGAGSLTDIFQVVSEGVLDKGMPPWKTMLKREELQSVVAFVKSLKGSHPADAKAPQGTEYKE